MKYIKVFQSAQDAEQQLAQITHPTLSAVRGGGLIGLNPGGSPVPPGPDPSEPFYIDVRGSVTLVAVSGLQMSTDKTNWTDTAAMTLPTGKTYFRVATDQESPLKPNWTESGSSDYDIGGNINSLVKVNFKNDTNCYSFTNNDGFFKDKIKLKSAGSLILPATTLFNGCYYGMFYGCTSLTTAPALPATTLTKNCYSGMFYGCTSLTTAPALPATTLTNSCYKNMFSGCTSLVNAPELPATTLDEMCYQGMFYGCTSLTTAPALPATTLASNCYYSMFSACTALTSAPALPATTLVVSCYRSMFGGCTSLTTAPVLSATKLANYCYNYMFSGCTKLNYIKCLATNISASNCTANWVSNVAATGTFVKDPNMSSWGTGNNGIPSGWTVQDAA